MHVRKPPKVKWTTWQRLERAREELKGWVTCLVCVKNNAKGGTDQKQAKNCGCGTVRGTQSDGTSVRPFSQTGEITDRIHQSVRPRILATLVLK